MTKMLNGKVVSTKLLSKDTYSAMQRIIHRGVTVATPSTTTAPTTTQPPQQQTPEVQTPQQPTTVEEQVPKEDAQTTTGQ